MGGNAGIWLISALSVAGVIFRPFRWPEWIFAAVGAVLLVALGLISPRDGIAGVRSGLDVYLFLAGMMLLAEIARREGLFDTLAALAAKRADGSPERLFVLIYLVATLVTVFLSNDATAVVMTPAVAAVARAARAPDAVPYLLVCAFVANAASFVLPISNPANLVVFGEHLPHLGEWLARFLLPSVLSIAATFACLRWSQQGALQGRLGEAVTVPPLSHGGRVAAIGLCVAALVLVVASSLGFELGWPTLLAALGTLALTSIAERRAPWGPLGGVSWDTLVLVAGLFVIVRALELSGVQDALAQAFQGPLNAAPRIGSLAIGTALAILTNLTNNLPLGLLAGAFAQGVELPQRVVDAILVGVDIGPNLSVTGSLATILWLTALRREGIEFGAWRFLKLGFLVMPPALVLALLAVAFQPW
ncbi:arsenic transporter [Aureimonas sp. AU4]|uniref:arsenic transporter n=1 Tax=Aureimonas sp. AU4 TaxID=1638163 RepID=UPI0007809A2E|nr:arsenic transporter [Aureimonas sp. AU4]